MLKKLKTIEEMSFKDLNLSENLMKAIADAGYENPTAVQAKSIPIVLSEKTFLRSADRNRKDGGFYSSDTAYTFGKRYGRN
jgi:Superfamily II DNA and RNA helicases